MPIFTFLETVRVSLGFGISTGSLIVDKRSAVLGTGYPADRGVECSASTEPLM